MHEALYICMGTQNYPRPPSFKSLEGLEYYISAQSTTARNPLQTIMAGLRRRLIKEIELLFIFHWYNYFLDLGNGRQTSFTTMVCPRDGINCHYWFHNPNDYWCSWLLKARAESAITQWEARLIRIDKEVQPSKFSIKVQTFCASLSKTSSANRP